MTHMIGKKWLTHFTFAKVVNQNKNQWDERVQHFDHLTGAWVEIKLKLEQKALNNWGWKPKLQNKKKGSTKM